MKVFLLLGALLLAGMLVLISSQDNGVSERTQPRTIDQPLDSNARTSQRALLPTAASSTEPSRSGLPVLPANASLTNAYPSFLQGTLVDAKGAPVHGAQVLALRVLDIDSTAVAQLDPHFRSSIKPTAETRTDAFGHFAFDLPRGIPFDIEARSYVDQGTAYLPARFAGESVILTLASNSLVYGRIMRSNGGPVAGAIVRLFQKYSMLMKETISDDAGNFVIRPQFRGAAYLQILPLEEEAIDCAPLQLEANSRVEMNFTLAKGVAVFGRVTDAVSGLPIAGATVGEGWELRRFATTDRDGRYSLPGIGGGGPYRLSARAAEYEVVTRMDLPPLPQTLPIQVDFGLSRGCSLSGRVVDSHGVPLGDVEIAVEGSINGSTGYEMERRSGTTSPDGRFRIGGLTSRFAYSVLLRKEGFAYVTLLAPQWGAHEQHTALEDITLPDPAILTGRISNVGDSPVEEIEIMLEGKGFWRKTRCTAGAAFALGELPPGDCTLYCYRLGCPPGPPVNASIPLGGVVEGILLDLPPSVTISGDVIGPEGHGLRGVVVHALLEEALDPGNEFHEAVSMETDNAGHFTLDGLVPGRYTVMANPIILGVSPDTPLLSASIAGIFPGSKVQIQLTTGETIQGELIDSSGAPLSNYSVRGWSVDRNRGTLTSITDAGGRFWIATDAGTIWDLEVNASLRDGGDEEPLLLEHGVRSGVHDVLLQIP